MGSAATKTPGQASSGPKFGKAMRDLFLFDPEYTNMNQGSYGCIPRDIQAKLREYQDACEAKPDIFIRFEYPELLERNRQAAATLLHAPLDTVVLVPNATTAISTILTNLTWSSDGNDQIIYFSTIYGACNRAIEHVVDLSFGKVTSHAIDIEYLLDDDAIVARFHEAVKASREAGKQPRACVFDAVSSVPGVRFPFEAMVRSCRELGITSILDAAQGVGMIEFQLEELDPDYCFTNCHKWLYVPRPCAVLYVPLRNQHNITATMPVSHGYRQPSSRPVDWDGVHNEDGSNAMVKMFSYVGTVDSSPFLCITDALKWRQDILGGEQKIMQYVINLARDGGKKCAEVLKTQVLDNQPQTATECALVNVLLPLNLSDQDNNLAKGQDGDSSESIPIRDAKLVSEWMMKVVAKEHKTFIVVYFYQGKLWTRLSAQVYLEIADFEWAGQILLDLCARVRQREYLSDS